MSMNRKRTALLIAAGVLALQGAVCAFAEEVEKVDTQGIAFEIPEDLRGLLYVQQEELEPDTLVSVFENASMEATEVLGEDNDGAGWIFSISKMPEARVQELRCGDMSGMEVFAEDEDVFYVYNHPTDVRMVRINNEQMAADQDQWTRITEWAWQDVRQEILANNPELDVETFSNTYLDMLLAQAAYKPGTKFELRSLDYGPDPLDPSTLVDEDYLEDLTEDFTYQIEDAAEAPDGEYTVLAFDDNGEEVRYDFFKAEEGRNLIREVRMVGEEEYETLYSAHFKDSDDENKTAADVVEAWCAAIVNGEEDD